MSWTEVDEEKMGLFRRGNIWWYEFLFARRRVRESARTMSKTVAKQAEQNRHRELFEVCRRHFVDAPDALLAIVRDAVEPFLETIASGRNQLFSPPAQSRT